MLKRGVGQIYHTDAACRCLDPLHERLAETIINGRYKAEGMHRRSWPNQSALGAAFRSGASDRDEFGILVRSMSSLMEQAGSVVLCVISSTGVST